MINSPSLRLIPLFALGLCAGLTAVAKADTITNFSLNSTLLGGGVADGTFVLDETNGTFTSGDVSLTGNGVNLTLSTIAAQFSNNGFSDVVLSSAADPGETFDLVLPTAPLKSYSGGAIASLSTDFFNPSFFDNRGFLDPVTGGVLNQEAVAATTSSISGSATAAQTPEAATLILVATGLFFGVFVLRARGEEPERPAPQVQDRHTEQPPSAIGAAVEL